MSLFRNAISLRGSFARLHLLSIGRLNKEYAFFTSFDVASAL